MSQIETAAEMIAEFSPTTASAFRNKPFHRIAIAQAFDASFTTHSSYTLKVVAFVTLAAKADVMDRAIGAA